MRHPLLRPTVLAAALCGSAAALAAGAALTHPLGPGSLGTPPVVEAADLARECRAAPSPPATGQLVRVRVRVDWVSDGPSEVRARHQFRAFQEPGDGAPGVAAGLPWSERGRLTPGDTVVVWAMPRGYADGWLDLGTAIPE